MKYMGSKARYAKDLLPIILKDRGIDQWYCEPFVGGANMIDKVSGELRLGVDINPYLIGLWKEVALGWVPPEVVDETTYNKVRLDKDSYPKELVGYIGFALSYGGKWFGGWCRDSVGKRNYVLESYKNANNQFPKLLGVKFELASYDNIVLPEKSLVYCDPPYKGTTKYSKEGFDHNSFYNWCRVKRSEGHTIFVSEYEMPEDFTCVYKKKVNSSLTRDTGSKVGVEKLFTLN